MDKSKSIADIRREYGHLGLDESTILTCPFKQFEHWLDDILNVAVDDPTAMTLVTVDQQGLPDARIVLLKGLQRKKFLFYTNYNSTKAEQLSLNPNVVLNFHWPQLARQIRIKGVASKTSSEQSDAYFASRPFESQVAASISPQSKTIESRQSLEESYQKKITEWRGSNVKRPTNWGGYQVAAFEFEFWQGRDNRLHDRILYQIINDEWDISRLAP